MRLFTLILGVFVAANAQSQEPTAAFDVADVHASPRGVRQGPLYLHANRLELHGYTMLELITMAYGVSDEKIFGGPNWLDTDRFEIIAKSERPLNVKTFQPSLQALLADRFGLKIKNDNKPEEIFALTIAKRGLLKESAAAGDPGCDKKLQDSYQILTCHNVTIEYFGNQLRLAAPNYFNHPVVDNTGLKGSYDLVVKYSGRGQLGGVSSDHPPISLFDTLEKQFGITASAGTRQAASLVIDGVNETPSPNPPGTIEKLPPQVTEFEVIETRPSKPGTKEDYRMTNGRLEAYWVTMKEMIGFAYNLDDYMLPGGEKWLETDHFDVIGKTDPNVTDGTLQAMLRTLLAKRFHLKSHFEEQPVTVWALTAPKGKGKLKDSTGEEHAGCKFAPKDGAFLLSCRNTTMSQFADKLPNQRGAAGYLTEHPMVDLTGLKGAYDFDIAWSPPARTYGRTIGDGGGTIPPGATNEAVAPDGGLTIFEAISKQLNLKLAAVKHPMPIVVIDHVDRPAADN
jgi:uncharacterized protein (TIGR03435 family)